MKDRIRLSRSNGSALVEFALTLPLLAIVLFGIIQYGFIFGAYITIRNASSVAARYAILGKVPPPTDVEIKAVARASLSPMLSSNISASGVIVDTNITIAGVSGKMTKVTINYDLPIVIKFVVLGTQVKNGKTIKTISASTVAR